MSDDNPIRFDPYDDELIKKYVIPKLRGERCPSGGRIVMKDVYAKQPWLLDHTMDSFFKKNEWYYFATRTQVSEKKPGHGQKARRRITGGNNGGSWKANGQEDIMDEETREIIGKKQTLNFTNSNGKGNKKMQKRGDGTCCDIIVPGSDSSWIMEEFMLPEGDGKFQTLVLCKIHVIKKSKKKDNHHEASPSSYHHEYFPSWEQHPITTDHESVLASFSDELQQKQSINEAHRRDAEIPRIGAEKNDQVIFGKIQESYKSKKKDNHHEASTYRHYLYSTSKQQLNNIGYESVIASSSEQQAINTICKIQEDKKDGHEARMYHQYDFVADSSSDKQPINEVNRHFQEILHIGAEKNVGSEKNDQVFETSSRLKDCENVTVKDINVCENLGSEKDKQEEEVEEEYEERDCIQQLEVWLMMTVNGSGLPKEEDDDILIYDTSLIDPDLLDQYATLRPKLRKLSTLRI